MGKYYAKFVGMLAVIILLVSPQTATWTENYLGEEGEVFPSLSNNQAAILLSMLKTSGSSPATIWYWKGYQVESNGDRYQFEIWARSEPPVSHGVMRDEKGEIVSEAIDDAVNYTTYAGGMAIAAPSGVKEPEVNMLYGVQRLTPRWVQELQSRSTLVTDRDRILSEMMVYLGDSSSAQAADDLQMYSEVGEAGLQTTYVFDRADGHVYVRQTMRDGEVVRVTVFPNKPVIWEGADPFAPLSPMGGKGAFQSPLAGQSK